MIRRIGDFFFRYRNLLFPIIFLILAFATRPIKGSEKYEAAIYALGILTALAGQTIRIATIGLKYIIRGGRKRKVYAEDLVTGGIFAHCRNPLYVGNILIVLGLTIIANSLPFYLVGIPAFLFIYYAIVRAEEAFLTEKFGEAYLAYCRDTNRFIPKLSGLGETFREMDFNWKRVLVKEYGTPYSWSIGTLFLMVKNRYLLVGDFRDKDYYLTLFAVFIVLTVLWASARYLKKSGTVVAD